MKALPHPVACYEEMLASAAFNSPLQWTDVRVKDYDGLVLPGGHAEGMKVGCAM